MVFDVGVRGLDSSEQLFACRREHSVGKGLFATLALSYQTNYHWNERQTAMDTEMGSLRIYHVNY